MKPNPLPRGTVLFAIVSFAAGLVACGTSPASPEAAAKPHPRASSTSLASASVTTPTTVPDPRVPLAVTIDDLPFVGPTARGESRQAALGRIVETLAKHGVPATGFVVCDRLRAAPGSLARWQAAGLALGNHSSSHRSLDDLSLDTWRADVSGCRDELTAIMGQPPRYFRYPYLQTGAERERRDAAAKALSAMGHERAPVTIDNSEWVAAKPYAEAVENGDVARAAAIASAYVEQLRLAARHYRQLARKRTGRDIAQVLLLHANGPAADHLERVLAMLRAEGFRFVSLEQALQDPVYRRSDDWVDPVGASWLYRIEPADPPAWGWDRGQLRAFQERFGLRAEAAHRIGKHLSVVPVEGASAWVVKHAQPIAANSLVFVATDGTPVLADTPWTPAATRELLDWVQMRFGRPPALATISHFHLDAAGGLAALRAAGVPIVASTDTARLLAEKAPAMQAQLAEEHGDAFRGWQLSAPDRTFDPQLGHRATVGGSEVQVIFPGGGHATDNVVTWFPAARLLFGGCLVKGGKTLGYLGDADLASYPAAVTKLMALDPAIVVPGHGDRLDVGQLAHTRALALAAQPQP